MCCCQVVFFCIQNKRSGGNLTAGTFECPAQANVCGSAALGKSTVQPGLKAWKGWLLFAGGCFSECAAEISRARPCGVQGCPSCRPVPLPPCCPGCRAGEGLRHVPVDGKDTRRTRGLEGAGCQARGVPRGPFSRSPRVGEAARHGGVCLLHRVQRCPEKALGDGGGLGFHGAGSG